MSTTPQEGTGQPEQPVTEAPAASAPPAQDERSQPAAAPVTPTDGVPQIAPKGDQPRRRRRRRRRRPRPTPDAVAAGSATALAETPAAPPNPAAQPAAAEGSPA